MSLIACPDCGYSLRGLPSAHRCPECGLEYDELTAIWKLRSNRIQYFIAVPLWLMGLRGFLGGASAFDRKWRFAILGTAAVLTLVAIFRQKFFGGENRRAAITPTGLLIRMNAGNQWVAWSDLVSLRVVGGARMAITVEVHWRRAAQSGLTEISRLFWKQWEAEQFCSRVYAARARYTRQIHGPLC